MTLCTAYKTSSSTYSPDEAECLQCSLKGCSICFTLIVAYLAVMFKKGNMLKIWNTAFRVQSSPADGHIRVSAETDSYISQHLCKAATACSVVISRWIEGSGPWWTSIRSSTHLSNYQDVREHIFERFVNVCGHVETEPAHQPHMCPTLPTDVDKTHQTHHVDSDQFLFPCK